MGKRAVGGFCLPLGSLTGDAADRRARRAGRGERSARRQDGGAADRPDSRVDRFARPRALLRVPPRRWGAPAARHALDRYAGLVSAVGGALDAPVRGGRRPVVLPGRPARFGGGARGRQCWERGCLLPGLSRGSGACSAAERDRGHSFPDHVPVVLNVVGQLIRVDGAETGFSEVLARLLLAPHRA